MDREQILLELKTYLINKRADGKKIHPQKLLKIIDALEEEYE